MRDMWRLSGIAVALIVLLRISIGWQFLYEGLWKLGTFASARPWTSAGYLRNARGPFRDLYRSMTGDPDDLDWLDYDNVASGWDLWKDRFIAHYSDLSDEQRAALSKMLDGPDRFEVRLAKLPDGIRFRGGLESVISYDPEAGLLIVNGKKHLLAAEKAELQKQAGAAKNANSQDVQAFLKALEQVARQASRLCFKERLLVLLKGDPERVGQVYRDDKTKEVVETRKGKIAQYKDQLARYDALLIKARQDFEHKHLATQWNDIQKLRAELVGPVRALDTELKDEARKLLTIDQLRRGPVPETWTPQWRLDHATIWALVGLGCLLIAGLFSRVAALAAAGLLLSFYLAVPPWPGVEEMIETAGPEHSFIINKNLIEVVALLGIACMPTGQWFGMDRLLAGLFRRSRK